MPEEVNKMKDNRQDLLLDEEVMKFHQIYCGEVPANIYKEHLIELINFLRDEMNYSEGDLTQVYIEYCNIINDYNTYLQQLECLECKENLFPFIDYLRIAFPEEHMRLNDSKKDEVSIDLYESPAYQPCYCKKRNKI